MRYALLAILAAVLVAGCATTTPPPDADPAVLVAELRRTEPNSEERGLACAALFATGARGVPHLARALPAAESSLRFDIYGIFLQLGPDAREAVPALVERLRHGDRTDRFCSMIALRAIGPEARDAVSALIPVLTDDSGYPPLRTFAAETLGAIGPDAIAATPALAKGLRVEDRTGTFVPAAKDALRSILEL